MAISLASRAVFLALLAGGMALGSVWLVLVAACAASMCARVFYPALAASLPALTGSRQELVGANAVVSGTEHVGSVIGPALAGAALIASLTRRGLLVRGRRRAPRGRGRRARPGADGRPTGSRQGGDASRADAS